MMYTAELTSPLHNQTGWTEVSHGSVQRVGEKLQVTPVLEKSRLPAMAAADCLIELSEDMKEADTGESVRIWKIR